MQAAAIKPMPIQEAACFQALGQRSDRQTP
jgi:hypothetical protein